MLKRLLRKLKSLFKAPKPELYPGKRADHYYGHKIGGISIETHAQMVKHTEFKPGEQYRLGEAVVTVHANRESMLAAIAVVDARRKATEERLTERGIEIMLMNPEELQGLKVEEFLRDNREKGGMFKRKLGWLWNKGKTNYFVKLEAKYAPSPNTVKPNANDTKDKVMIAEKASHKQLLND
jgi:hypothetical protein